MNQMQNRKLIHGEEQISTLELGTSSIQAAGSFWMPEPPRLGRHLQNISVYSMHWINRAF